MGKNNVIKTLGKRIGNIILHSLLVEHTNRSESISHLQNEEATYRDAAVKEAKKYNWNEEDKQAIKTQANEFIKNKKNTKYTDVKFSIDEADKLIEDEIINLKL